MLKIDGAILDEAAEWLVKLHATDVTEAERRDWLRWHAQSTQHAQAWARAERLLARIGGVPGELARPVLGRNHNAMRRQFVGKLAVLLAVAPSAWTAWHFGPAWSADFHTGTGEQKQLALADGSLVMLNTATALDVRFDTRYRLLQLIQGEVLVDTARDVQTPARPFMVTSAEGTMRAIGTRFSVQQLDGQTRLTVLQGAVEIVPWDASDQRRIVAAGETSVFSRRQIEAPGPASENSVAWIRGMLIADAMPLETLVAELSRYRTGVMRCDPAVAGMPVSGAFPIHNIESSLSMLRSTYALKVTYATRFWVSIAPH